MRRFAASLVMMSLVGSGSLALAGTAAAASGRPASFCTAARSVADQELDPTRSPTASTSPASSGVEEARQTGAVVTRDGVPAHQRLLLVAGGLRRRPDRFRRHGRLHRAGRKVRRALKKVFTYLSSTCDLDVG